MFPAGFRTKTPVQTASPTAAWVGRNRPVNVSSASFDSLTLPYTKIGLIAVITEELANQSSFAAEQVIIRILRDSIAYGEDNLFLNPAIAGVSDQNPPSATYGGVGQALAHRTKTHRLNKQ